MTSTITKFAAFVGIALLAGCGASRSGGDFVHDPYEQTNRMMHGVNKGIDTVALRPAAQLYDVATPALVKHLASNALDMLDLPIDAANHLLQGDVMAAVRTAGRFGVNLIMGAGVLDPATELGLPKEENDFGRTLAAAGVNEGAFLEVPFLGPKTERDLAGFIMDTLANPLSFATFVPSVASLSSFGVGLMDTRHEYFDQIDRIYYDSEDSYISSRTTYLQLRRRTVAGGATAESLPDVFAE